MKEASKVKFTVNYYGLLVKVLAHSDDEFDTVIILELQ
jgi:hypothetical protein